jgi:hypothetical protein
MDAAQVAGAVIKQCNHGNSLAEFGTRMKYRF